MPTGHGNRITKARTEKQRAHAKAYSASHAPVSVPADAGVPKDSWWTRAKTREEFDAIAAQERSRIVSSKFSTGTLLLAKDTERI